MPPARRAPGRPSLHSREQIVATAIRVLDREGPGGLTLRGLAAELGGGLGSVYHHVAGKAEVLDLASDELIGRGLAAGTDPDADVPSPPVEVDLGADDPAVLEAVATLRRTALALFAEMDRHPWLAAQARLSGGSRPNSLRMWEHLGRPLAAMGLSPRQQFHGSTALTGYVLGVASEMAAQDEVADPTRSKDEQLGAIAETWQGPEYDDLPWLRSMADEFRRHDDVVQVAAGLDLLLAGLVRQAVDGG